MAEIGTLEWARLTGGNLTSAERRRLFGAILRTTVRYVAGRLRMVFGTLPARRASLDLDTFRLPDFGGVGAICGMIALADDGVSLGK